LLITQAWYPEHKPKYKTQGWWYAPSEEVLGRVCKSCSVFYEFAEFVGSKRRKESLGGWRRRSQGMEDGLRIGRRRSPRESREGLRQVGRAQGEVRKPKCQRRHY
jgi:hypothetical protein